MRLAALLFGAALAWLFGRRWARAQGFRHGLEWVEMLDERHAVTGSLS